MMFHIFMEIIRTVNVIRAMKYALVSDVCGLWITLEKIILYGFKIYSCGVFCAPGIVADDFEGEHY